MTENIGEPLDSEKAYWGGQHPAVDPGEEPDGYPLPFHPLELGEEALREFFGFQIEGFHNATLQILFSAQMAASGQERQLANHCSAQLWRILRSDSPMLKHLSERMTASSWSTRSLASCSNVD